MPLSNIRQELNRKQGRLQQLEQDKETVTKKLRDLNKQSRRIETAQTIIQQTAQQTQEQLKYRVSELGTLALSAIFDDPYELNLDFELRRNRTEADITLSKGDGEKINPLDAAGGGVADVTSFGLRSSLLTLRKPPLRRTVILDEPFRYLDRKAQVKAGLLLNELSDRMNIQFIIISHDEAVVEGADKVFEVIQQNEISKVQERTL